ncbi:hypothetical protein D3C71_2045900 [compost metagenome]
MYDGVLADICQSHEFMCIRTANGAGIRFNCTELQAATGENVHIRIKHGLIAGI